MQHEPYREGKDYTVEPATGCWMWQRRLSGDGYGVVTDWAPRRHRLGIERSAHRESYRRRHGPIPEGLQLHHICANKACINPDHLQAVTHGEHMALEAPHSAKAQTAQALRSQGMKYEDIAQVLECSRTTAFRLVNPSSYDRDYRAERREHYRDLGRNYRARLAGECKQCGAPVTGTNGPATSGPTLCRDCYRAVIGKRSTERRQRIQELWKRGVSIRGIAEALDSTESAIGVDLHRMRSDGGWDVPHRYKVRS